MFKKFITKKETNNENKSMIFNKDIEFINKLLNEIEKEFPNDYNFLKHMNIEFNLP